jgi:hypothetical protein
VAFQLSYSEITSGSERIISGRRLQLKASINTIEGSTLYGLEVKHPLFLSEVTKTCWLVQLGSLLQDFHRSRVEWGEIVMQYEPVSRQVVTTFIYDVLSGRRWKSESSTEKSVYCEVVFQSYLQSDLAGRPFRSGPISFQV